MKKFKLFLSISILSLSVSLTACSKSNESLIKDYEKVTTEIVEAVKDGDLSKADELAKKADKILNELNTRELTDEEKEQIMQISVSSAAGTISGAQDAFKGAFEDAGDIFNEALGED